MTGYVDVTTDPQGPANSLCPPYVCCSITVPVPDSDQRAWIENKTPVTGGHQKFDVPDLYFQDNRCLVSVILHWGSTQWSFQDYLTNGGILKVERYFGTSPAVTGECTKGDTECDPEGHLWTCSPDTRIWVKTTDPCTPPIIPEPGPWGSPAEIKLSNLMVIGVGVLVFVIMIVLVAVIKKRGKTA